MSTQDEDHNPSLTLSETISDLTLVRRAIPGPQTDDMTEQHRLSAIQHLIQSYRLPILIFLQRHRCSEDIAEDIFQTIAVRLIEGRYAKYSADKGRFRDYLKVVLVNELNRVRRETRPYQLATDALVAPDSDRSELDDFDRTTLNWLIQTALERLISGESTIERDDGALLSYIVSFQYEHSRRARSQELAFFLEQRSGLPVTRGTARQHKRRAQVRLLQMVRRVTSEMLNSNNSTRIDDVLCDLKLAQFFEDI